MGANRERAREGRERGKEEKKGDSLRERGREFEGERERQRY